jgi:glutamate carboxypeptidase
MNSLDFFTDRLPDYLEELKTLTEIETPTGELANLERAAQFLAERLAPFGNHERCNLQDHGPLLRLRREGIGSRVLLLAHYDTVWPVGTWQNLWNVSHGRAHGPGIYDMKGGLLFIPWMLRYFDAGDFDHPEIEVLLNPDEEIMETSRSRAKDPASTWSPFAVDPVTRGRSRKRASTLSLKRRTRFSGCWSSKTQWSEQRSDRT